MCEKLELRFGARDLLRAICWFAIDAEETVGGWLVSGKRAASGSRLLAVFLGWICLLVPACAAWAEGEPRRPNILLIYTDDQGTLDMGCYGTSDLVTPNMDRLAQEGIRFTQMYAPSAICSASRAGLLTAKLPPRAGVPANCSSQPGVPGMPGEEVTLAELLKQAGYATAHIGKWHLGYSPETMPNAQGFDYSFGHMGGCIDNYSHFFYWNGPNRHDLWRNGKEVWYDGQYFLDLMVRECLQFVEEHREGPFFVYWAINMPHYPLQPKLDWRRRFSHLRMPRRDYAAFLATVDEAIGVVLDRLDEWGLRRRTLVLIQSDHGHSTEVRAFGGGGYAGPYRGAKGCLFEGGIRVPAVVSWPGVLPEGEVRDQMVTGCDWLPTLAKLCGVPVPEGVDGKDIWPVLLSAEAPSPHRSWYWRLGRGPKAQWAVREGYWKLLGNPRDTSNRAPLGPDDKLFLVNLRTDPGEERNVANRHPTVVSRLLRIRNQVEAGIAAE